MRRRQTKLEDKYLDQERRVLLNGIQALVRLPLDQRRRDQAAGLNTAGYISGYRGSPIASYDMELDKAADLLARHHVRFQPGVNEELAATAVSGSQQVNLHPKANYDGVFGIWYGKGPGVDRSGDALKHANYAGTSKHGGVLAIAADDPRAKSTAFPQQSEFAFIDAEIPILNPADLQDLLDFGLLGFEMSRFAGLWVCVIAPGDALDGTQIIDVDPLRFSARHPQDFFAPPDMINVRPEHMALGNRFQSEERLRHFKLPAAQAFVRANRLDRVTVDAPKARLGIAAVGRAYAEFRQAMRMLGIDDAQAARLGLRIYKVAMPWPLEPEGLREFAQGLDAVLVVESKRPLVETQIKEQLYHWPADRRPRILGKRDADGAPLLSDLFDLTAEEIAGALYRLLPDDAKTLPMRRAIDGMNGHREAIQTVVQTATRIPYFCSGCPHNVSTKVPEGARAAPGVGCHIMAQWMDRTTEAYVQMGGEGASWLGQFPFTGEKHMFVNLGDGTYYHSGHLAIRAAVAARAPVTFKILYNDAVAMTGGQSVEGPLSVPSITRQLAAEGVARIVVLSETPEAYGRGSDLADDVEVHGRDYLDSVQEDMRSYDGVSALIFDQTCAAEKRRRRRKGLLAEPATHLFINDAVCEACGDCSQASNCISVEPLETEFGTKRAINQSSCNKDYSCADGFCPAFVAVKGAKLRKTPAADLAPVLAAAGPLPDPHMPELEVTRNILITGIGGTGVSTVAAVLAMAAYLDGRETAALNMTGLAQKGGAVISHLRIGPKGRVIYGPRIPVASTDTLIAGDLLTAAGQESLMLTSEGRTTAVYNAKVSPTATFVARQKENFATDELVAALAKSCRASDGLDAGGMAARLFGDSLYANVLLLGAAFQRGLIPLTAGAIEDAIALNGAAVETNLAAFAAGRLWVHDRGALDPGEDGAPDTEPGLDDIVARRVQDLAAYQNSAYAERYRDLVDRVRVAEAGAGDDWKLSEAVARNLYKLMAYKDEYEVARLYSDPAFADKLKHQFAGDLKLAVRLAPPLLSRRDPLTGHPRKREFGAWILPLFGVLRRFKLLRGTPFDPFGYTAERRMERGLITNYERTVTHLIARLSPATHDLAVRIAEVPDGIRGFGHVKAANAAAAETAAADLLAAFDAAFDGGGDTPVMQAAE